MYSVKPYARLASQYDWIMRHVDYPGWANYLKTLIDKHALPLDCVLELATGTGSFAKAGLFSGAKKLVVSDLSPHMLGEAIKGQKNPLPLVHNALHTPFKKGTFSSVWMLYDSLNYLPGEQALISFFSELKGIVKPGGYFVADITTALNSQRYFADFLDWEENEHCSMIRQSSFEASQRLQINNFVLFFKESNGHYTRFEEQHVQYIFPWKEMVKMAQKSGWEHIAAYQNQSLEPAKSTAERVHLVWKCPS